MSSAPCCDGWAPVEIGRPGWIVETGRPREVDDLVEHTEVIGEEQAIDFDRCRFLAGVAPASGWIVAAMTRSKLNSRRRLRVRGHVAVDRRPVVTVRDVGRPADHHEHRVAICIRIQVRPRRPWRGRSRTRRSRRCSRRRRGSRPSRWPDSPARAPCSGDCPSNTADASCHVRRRGGCTAGWPRTQPWACEPPRRCRQACQTRSPRSAAHTWSGPQDVEPPPTP